MFCQEGDISVSSHVDSRRELTSVQYISDHENPIILFSPEYDYWEFVQDRDLGEVFHFMQESGTELVIIKSVERQDVISPSIELEFCLISSLYFTLTLMIFIKAKHLPQHRVYSSGTWTVLCPCSGYQDPPPQPCQTRPAGDREERNLNRRTAAGLLTFPG